MRLKIRENRERSCWNFTPNKNDLTFWTLNHCAKFDQNQKQIAAVRVRTDKRTVSHKMIFIHAMLQQWDR